MLGKIIGATVGRKVANKVGTKVGGPAGAAIGYGLASRRFRKFGLAGLAVAGGVAAYRALKERGSISEMKTRVKAAVSDRDDAPETLPNTNKDPLPAYAPHA
jgi:uncharacterized membrane protein YebE (DUF533 family)